MLTAQLRLEANSDLLTSLTNTAIDKNELGYILGVVGNLSIARFQCPEKNTPSVFKGNLEIISLNGTISPDGCHLHLGISDKNCKVWGGHLEQGTVILKKADLLIGFIEGAFTKSLNQTLNPSNKNIEIYTLPSCPWSVRAVRMLRTLQISHEVIIINNDSDFHALKARTKSSSFPQIFINKEFIGGYSELAELHAQGFLNQDSTNTA